MYLSSKAISVYSCEGALSLDVFFVAMEIHDGLRVYYTELTHHFWNACWWEVGIWPMTVNTRRKPFPFLHFWQSTSFWLLVKSALHSCLWLILDPFVVGEGRGGTECELSNPRACNGGRTRPSIIFMHLCLNLQDLIKYTTVFSPNVVYNVAFDCKPMEL